MCNLFSSLIRRRSGITVSWQITALKLSGLMPITEYPALYPGKRKVVLHPHRSPLIAFGIELVYLADSTCVQPK